MVLSGALMGDRSRNRWVDRVPAEVRAVTRLRCAVAVGHGKSAHFAVSEAVNGAVASILGALELEDDCSGVVRGIVDEIFAREDREWAQLAHQAATAFIGRQLLAPSVALAAAELSRRHIASAARSLAVGACVSGLVLNVEVAVEVGAVVAMLTERVEQEHIIMGQLITELAEEYALEIVMEAPLTPEDREAEALLEMIEKETALAAYERQRAKEAYELRKAAAAEAQRKKDKERKQVLLAQAREKKSLASRRAEAAAKVAAEKAAIENTRLERLRQANEAAAREKAAAAKAADEAAAAGRAAEMQAKAAALRSSGWAPLPAPLSPPCQ